MNKGFTLIDLLAYIIILSIVILTIVSAFQGGILR